MMDRFNLAGGLVVLGALGMLFGACGDDDRRPFVVQPDAAPPSFTDGGVDLETTAPQEPPLPVDVVITADNAYSFGWGDDQAVDTFYENKVARSAGEVFDCPIGHGPEAYLVPTADALPGAWLYIVSWADYQTSQGVIGQFERRGGEPIFTGTGEWEVCATGKAYSDGLARPDKATVNEEIAKCNAATGDPKKTSAGWVGPNGSITPNAQGKVVFGQDNQSDVDKRGTPGYAFPPVCKRDVTHEGRGINGNARWMWYAPPGFDGDPFLATGLNDTRTFLVFRLPTRAIPPPEPK